MRRYLLATAIAWALASYLPVASGDRPVSSQPASQPDTQSRINEAIVRLAGHDFQLRQEAESFLWRAGRKAESALRAATTGPNAEAAERATRLLPLVELDVRPDTEQRIIDAVRGVLEKTGKERSPHLLSLGTSEGRAGGIFVRILRREGIKRVWADLDCSGSSPNGDLCLARIFIAEGHLDQAGELIKECSTFASRLGPYAARDWAAFLLFRGRLDAELKRLTATPLGKDDSQRMVPYLYLAKGDLANADAAAGPCLAHEEDPAVRNYQDDLPDISVQIEHATAFRSADWKRLVKLNATTSPADSRYNDGLMAQAIFRRLGGDDAGCGQALTELVEIYGRKEKPADRWHPALQLLLNDRIEEGVELLARCGQWEKAFELLTQQCRYGEALLLIERAREAQYPGMVALDILAAKTLHTLGEHKRAEQLLDAVAASPAGEYHWPEKRVISVERELGLDQRAFARAIKRMTGPQPVKPEDVLPWLFATAHGGEKTWWTFVRRQFPQDTLEASLQRVRTIIDGKASADDLTNWLRAAATMAEPMWPDARWTWLTYLAKTAQSYGLTDQALELFTASGDVSGWYTPAADVEIGQKRWLSAADLYRRAWENSPSSPEPLYLQGRALANAGQAELGRTLMSRASMMCLADPIEWTGLIDHLHALGLADDVREQLQLATRVCDWRSRFAGSLYTRSGFDLAARGEHAAALLQFERYRVWLALRGGELDYITGYLALSRWVHALRVREAVAAGRRADAATAARFLARIQPAEQQTLDVIRALDGAGWTAEADDTFDIVRRALEAVCEQHPRSAVHHNLLAWASAGCRRNLESALANAQRAVELQPGEAAFLDTLAEVNFQLGRFDKAIELEERCVRMSPTGEVYRRQLGRFKSGSPTTAPQ